MKYNTRRKAPVLIYANLSESQLEGFQRLIATLPFKITYRNEARGPLSVAVITCTPSQEKTVREILNGLGPARRAA